MLTPNRIAVAKMQPWLNGTCVTINQSFGVKAFLPENANPINETKYKTVNIYSLSHKSWNLIIKRLDKHILENRVNSYYETVFAEMVADGSLSFNASSFDNKPWYEIDTIHDLKHAEKLFSQKKYQGPKTADSLSLGYFNENLLGGIISSPQIAGGLSVAK